MERIKEVFLGILVFLLLYFLLCIFVSLIFSIFKLIVKKESFF